MKVFLGGPVNTSNWRKQLISMLKIDYYNPDVEQWNFATYKNELEAKQNCDYYLCIVTPQMCSTYSIAEIVDESNKHPEKTIFCYMEHDNGNEFDNHQKKSLERTCQMIELNGGKSFRTLDEVAQFLNKQVNSKL